MSKVELFTTTEVAMIEEITPVIAQRWAKDNGVAQVGKYYFWSRGNMEAFKNRKKSRGPIPKGELA